LDNQAFLTNNFQVQIHEQDKIRDEGFNSSAPSSIHDSDESSDDSASEAEESDNVPASQEEAAEDVEGVMPEAIEEGHSPIDDLKGFNWGAADEELESFMGSDSESENESGAESVASNGSVRSRSSNKITPRKRKLGEATDDEDSDNDESALAKKQRIANSRSTGLKTVKTPNSMQSESSLPTPGVTGDEEGEEDPVDQIPTGDDDDDGDDPFGDDLEADLMAEFAREEEESKVGDGAGE
jgi:RNA polymerase II subunit A C-terminal domain phosphatase